MCTARQLASLVFQVLNVGLILAVDLADPKFVKSLPIPGRIRDLSPGRDQGLIANLNRFGFGSDLTYDSSKGLFYSLADRGPGGGVIPFDTRVHVLNITFDPETNAVGQVLLERTLLLKDTNGKSFNGLNPGLLHGDNSTIGNSLDPEGIAVGPGGTLFIAEEYGPSLYEFDNNGTFLRAFEVPDNLIPRIGGQPYYVGFPESGRQDNRGYEGLTMNKAGDKLYAILQGPLAEEGQHITTQKPDGGFGRYVRIVEFDIPSGKSTGQYLYELESVSEINKGLEGTEKFNTSQQGRDIGVSAISAISDTEFLVLERDDRGMGTEDPVAQLDLGLKSVFKIDLTGATNVAEVSLRNLTALPEGVVPVKKELYLDIKKSLKESGKKAVEKLEGLAFGPRSARGTYPLLIVSDNDFSVTQIAGAQQLDVCTDRVTNTTQVAIDALCPPGQRLIPSMIYSFSTGTPQAPATSG